MKLTRRFTDGEGSAEHRAGRKTIVSIIGTRPEAIKMAPVIRELEKNPKRFKSVVLSTDQHKELLEQAMKAFSLKADISLDLMQANQGLSEFAARSLSAVSRTFERLKPDMVLVQGDTTTVVTSALAGFYNRISVGHVEAGLRSNDRDNPFPEEINRRVAGVIADLHFAPTEGARDNLLSGAVPCENIFLTGNTVVDALRSVRATGEWDNPELEAISNAPGRMILVTAHRRENHGEPLRAICNALLALVHRHDDLRVVWPVHLNPAVKSVVDEMLSKAPRIHIIPAASYTDLLRLMRASWLLLSDSGGIQEEAPSLNKPLLILREVTERPEVVEVGAAKLVGTNVMRIMDEVSRLTMDSRAYDRMACAPNPFGDGRAACRIVAAIANHLGVHEAGDARDEFVPPQRMQRSGAA